MNFLLEQLLKEYQKNQVNEPFGGQSQNQNDGNANLDINIDEVSPFSQSNLNNLKTFNQNSGYKNFENINGQL